MFINDGFTLNGTVRARGPFPEMTFKYRLSLPERTQEWRWARAQAKDAKQQFKLDAQFAAEHVLEWSDDRKIVWESFKTIAPFAMTEIIDAITAYTFPDQEADTKN